jgi:hypothetical protein
MTTRWIWLVPSYIWVIVHQRAVSAGQNPVGSRVISTGGSRRTAASDIVVSVADGVGSMLGRGPRCSCAHGVSWISLLADARGGTGVAIPNGLRGVYEVRRSDHSGG